MCYIRKLVRADIKLSGKNLSVTYCLVQHIDKVRVLENVFHFLGCQQILDVLGDACGNSSPLSETLPDFHGIGCCLVFSEKKVHLIHVVPCGSALASVLGYPSPYLIVIGNLTLLP